VSANPDVVIVGGGIGGSALAAVLAKQGAEVLVLERQQTYKDRVRGEYMAPWGVEETQRLGLLDVLLGAGGHFCPRYIPYDELTPPEIAEQHPVDMGKVIPGIAGALCVSHPGACEALARPAAAAGATVLRGVTNVSVEPGARPKVRFSGAGTEQVVEPRLVVGADGRTSSVRRPGRDRGDPVRAQPGRGTRQRLRAGDRDPRRSRCRSGPGGRDRRPCLSDLRRG